MPMFTYNDLYNDSGAARTRTLFCEYNPDGILTLNRFGKEGRVSLYQLYIIHATEDPSEVQFAEEVFGDILYWKRLQGESFFKSHIAEWRDVAAEKRKQLAFKAVVNEVKTEGRSSFTAAKYLIEEPWRSGSTASEKKAIRKNIEQTAEAAYQNQSLQDDITRLMEEGILKN